MTETSLAYDLDLGDEDIGHVWTLEELRNQEFLSRQEWRLNNMYKIRDKSGKIVDFCMNEAQEYLYHNMWFLNVILKARQLGFSTFIDVFILDTCLFNPTISTGIIAHHVDDAKAIYEDKIKLPYLLLDEDFRKMVSATTDRAGEIKFNNGSSIRVSTSFRSGTLQILHVSELGKIAAKYPERAKEIRTGAFEAVAKGQQIFVESTAEGREGEFYDLCTDAKALQDQAVELNELDFKFFFFPWWQNPEYVAEERTTLFTSEDELYFRDLEGRGIKLTREQKAWWIKKHKSLKEEMYREHPSYPEEAFKASIEGAYYGVTITELRRKGRIGKVPHEPGFPVQTFWDLGMNDMMSIWFFQQIGRERRVIDFEQAQGEGLGYYANMLVDKPYVYGTHYWPHDGSVRELGTGKRRDEVAINLGISPITLVERPKNNDQLMDQIDQTRNFLKTCWIDESNCFEGIKALEGYRKEWDERLGTFKKSPLHNWASHPADAFRVGAVGFFDSDRMGINDVLPPEIPDY